MYLPEFDNSMKQDCLLMLCKAEMPHNPRNYSTLSPIQNQHSCDLVNLIMSKMTTLDLILHNSTNILILVFGENLYFVHVQYSNTYFVYVM